MSKDQIANPDAPTNDREFRVWEDGRRQGQREARGVALTEPERELLRAGYRFAKAPLTMGDDDDQSNYHAARYVLENSAADLIGEELKEVRRRRYPNER